MDERLPREEVLRRLSLEHRRLMNTFARLTPEQWVAPSAVGTWTAKDVLAHLIFWNEYVIGEVQAATNGIPYIYPEGTTDEINERAVARYQDRSAEDVHHTFEQTYSELLSCIERLPKSAFEADSAIERALDETIHGALANNTYEHWPIHEAQIREWLAKQS
jgi:hypothetical protein